jgi:uncharacterized protein YndB with AHSA1/START domain
MSDIWGVLEAGTVTFTRRYATTAADLWGAVTDPDRLGRWLGPVDGDLRVGGHYALAMGADESQTSTGEILACDRATGRLAVAWRFPGEDESRVDVEVRDDGDAALLVLVHTELTEAGGRGYGAGWHATLALLDDHVAGRPVRAWDDAFDDALPHYRAGA